MKGIFAGGATIVLILTAAAASAQLGGSAGAGVNGAGVGGTIGTGTAGGGVAANMETGAALATETTPEPSGDLKRATRKSRRDVAKTVDGGASVEGRAAVSSSPESRMPGGGS